MVSGKPAAVPLEIIVSRKKKKPRTVGRSFIVREA
jgi:hypothetical protein